MTWGRDTTGRGVTNAWLTVAAVAPLVMAMMLSPVGEDAQGARGNGQVATVVAQYELNEPFGTRVMIDSSTGGHDGVVNPDGVTANGSYYHWQQRCPSCPPTDPSRVVQVPDSSALEVPDASVAYSLEFRYRTKSSVGNVMQKGQSGSLGGQIKVQIPNGRVQCLFKGANGVRVGSGSPTDTSDGQWHIVRCVRKATQVETWIDGVRVGLKKGSTGLIDNSKPFVVGGKLSCDQMSTTCDYYSGDIDWIKISQGS